MSLAELAAAVAILAVLLTMAYFLFRPRRPAAIATRATGKRSGAPPASSTTSGGSENVAAPLSAISGHGAGTPAGHQPSDGCGHSAASSSHGDIGSFSDSGSCGVH